MDLGKRCNIIIMCWSPGQSSTFHGHEGSRCLVKVLSGNLKELRAPHPKYNNDHLSVGRLIEQQLKDGDVCYIDDMIGLHKVRNESLNDPAITLHIYLPAYTKCRIFAESNELLTNGATFSMSTSDVVDVTFSGTEH